MEGYVAEIEQEVLGTLLTGGAFPLVSTVCHVDHMIHPAHKRIFEACKISHERTGTCALPSAVNFLDKEALTKEVAVMGVNAGQYLASLCAGIVSGKPRIVESAKKVVEQYARLAISEELAVLSEASAQPSCDIRKIVSRAGERLDDIMVDVRRGANRKTRYRVEEATQNALEQAREARQRGSGLTGVTWGFADVNRVTGGLQKRELTLMAARPSMGKTSVAMSSALRMAQAGHSVGMISLEMDAEKVCLRMASDYSYDRGLKLAYADVIRGSCSEENLEEMFRITQKFNELPLHIEDQSGLRMSDIRVKLESLLETCQSEGNPLEVLIIDHIGLIKPSTRYSGNRVNEMAEISSGLKSIAREYDIAVLALSQLSRLVEQRENKRPTLSDLRDSGALEQDADTVIFLYREAYYLDRERKHGEAEDERIRKLIDSQNKLEFIIAKQRNGAIRTIDLFADMAFSAIRNAA